MPPSWCLQEFSSGFILCDCCFRLFLVSFSISPHGKWVPLFYKGQVSHPFPHHVMPQLLCIKNGDEAPNRDIYSPCSISCQGICLSLCLFPAVPICDGKHLDFPDATESPSCKAQSQCYSRSRLQVIWESAIIICWLLEIFGF